MGVGAPIFLLGFLLIYLDSGLFLNMMGVVFLGLGAALVIYGALFLWAYGMRAEGPFFGLPIDKACPSCGMVNRESDGRATFCKYCGTKIS